MKRYVQHISGQGEKWELSENETLCDDESDYEVCVRDTDTYYYLPKSEYRLCDPPERWVGITQHCDIWENQIYLNGDRLPRNGYRLVQKQILGSECPQWAFIVEKREP